MRETDQQRTVQAPFRVYVEEPLFAREYIFDPIQANITISDEIFEPPPGATESRDLLVS